MAVQIFMNYNYLSVLVMGRREFDRMTGHAGFAVDKVALGQCCLQELQFFPVTIIPPRPA